jgi:hypothetical protein
MRERAELEEEVAESNALNNGSDTIALLQLEVLLDIRDLLERVHNRVDDLRGL